MEWPLKRGREKERGEEKRPGSDHDQPTGTVFIQHYDPSHSAVLLKIAPPDTGEEWQHSQA